jgi:small-conductance mechanosensitive channel
MHVTHQRTVRAIAALLVIATLTQSVYTALYVAKLDVPRQLLWGAEGLLFPLLAALAGAAMVRSQRLTLAFAAIAFAAVLNLVQVGVGLTLFIPFSDAAKADPALAPVAGAIVAFAFFVYNAAKLLLGFAALLVGLSRLAAGSRALGGATALVGGMAMLANGVAIAAGDTVFGGIPLPGGSGVLATLLLALCLFGAGRDD